MDVDSESNPSKPVEMEMEESGEREVRTSLWFFSETHLESYVIAVAVLFQFLKLEG